MLTIVNNSAGNLHLDSLGVVMIAGDRLNMYCTKAELLVQCPELTFFIDRNRALILDTQNSGEV